MRTKIVCTIGPASSSVTKLKKMIEAGMTVARVNFSHGDHKSNGILIQNIRRAAEDLGENIGLMADLQGPRIRVARLSAPISVKPGQNVVVLKKSSSGSSSPSTPESDPPAFAIDGARLLKHLKKGDPIFIDNGMLELIVQGKTKNGINCKVKTGGTINARKGLNIPRISPFLTSFTKNDWKSLKFAISRNADFIAMSFVKTQKDILNLKKAIKKILPNARPHELPAVVAKIETSAAVKNFDKILKITDGIMIARGDLAIETPQEQVPTLQKQMIKKCLHNAKPVIVATQMLESMMENPRPTRAEINDVANSVIDHTDAVMLSGESALGKYPVKTVQIMKKIATYTETGPYDDLDYKEIQIKELVPFSLIARAAVMLAREMQLKNIIIRNAPLAMTYKVSRFRPEVNIWHLNRNRFESRKLSLAWGVQVIDAVRNIKGGYVLIDGVSKDHGRIEYKISHKV
ncbi:MAG: pyruvate kinase [Patescibacteria group bacterium]|nr:pyruvate kinase [Patescibacteria group bacterium]